MVREKNSISFSPDFISDLTKLQAMRQYQGLSQNNLSDASTNIMQGSNFM